MGKAGANHKSKDVIGFVERLSCTDSLPIIRSRQRQEPVLERLSMQ